MKILFELFFGVIDIFKNAINSIFGDGTFTILLIIILTVPLLFIIRIPSIVGSISARTKGRMTRSIKGSYNPYYGKKGTGMVTNPKRAVRNKVYRSRSRKLF